MILPRLLPNVLVGFLKIGVLNTLNASARNCRYAPSRCENGNFLSCAAFAELIPGPIRSFVQGLHTCPTWELRTPSGRTIAPVVRPSSGPWKALGCRLHSAVVAASL